MATVTVIIPVRNDRRVARALDSVLAQRLPDGIALQVIVVDDSDDDTPDVLLQYRSRVAITSTPGGVRGVYAARNHGLTLARGDFVNFLGADDVYADDNVLLDLIKLFDKTLDRSAPGFVHGWVTMVNPNGASWDLPRGPMLDLYKQGYILPDLATLWTRSVFDAYGGYEEHYHVAGDHEFYRRVVLRHRTPHFCLDRTVALMAVGGLSARKSMRDEIRTAYELWLCMRPHPRVPPPFRGHNSYPARFCTGGLNCASVASSRVCGRGAACCRFTS